MQREKSNKFIYFIILCINLLWGEIYSQTLKGYVTDTNNERLIGVSVLVKGTGDGTITDFDGQYVLNNLKEGEKIEFSYVGMQTKVFTYKGQKTLNVTLSENSELLEEVVVVGYGQQKKESVVGSITQAKGEDLLRAGNVTTVSEALTGIMSGVSTMQAAGQPGSTAANILIRGQSTWTDSSPLFVVDGVERDFNDLDPNEIESISVLKDASATAVYGVKAANGVILITTKQGAKGKTKINFSANFGIKSPTIDTDYITDYPTNLRHHNLALINENSFSKLHTQEEIARWEDPNRDMDYYSYTNFINYLLTNGQSQAYNLNISGGNDFVKYFTSFGYNYDGDIFDIKKQSEFDPRTYQKRYNWRSNLDFNLTKTTKFSVKLSGDVKDWNGNYITKSTNGGMGAGNGDDLSRLYQFAMVGAPPINSEGLIGTEPNTPSNPNYWAMMEKEGQWMRRSNRLYSDFILKQQIIKGLEFTAKLSYNYYRRYDSSIDAKPIYYHPNPDNTGYIQKDPLQLPESPVVSAEYLADYNKSLYYEFSLLYKNKIGKHDFSLLALMNRRKYQSKVSFPNLEESWVGRATYGYDNRYLFEFNGAYNGNENFAPGKRFGFFPSVALGWVVSEEKFIKDHLPGLEFFKIRYSYGEIGSDRGLGGQRYSYLSTYSSYNSNLYYGEPVSGIGTVYVEGTPANVNNTWETAIKQNIGIEMTFLKSRLRGSVDLFNERREGILMQRNTVPYWFGNSAPKANLGKTKNHGIDIELKWNDKIGKVDYWFTGNMSLTENRIVFRDDAKSTPEYLRQAGKPIGWRSGLVDLGLYQNWDDIYNYPVSSYNTTGLIPGDLIYMDYTGDGIVDKNDWIPIKDPSYATKTYAFSLGFSYKGFSVSAMFNGMFGLSKYVSGAYLWEWDTTVQSGFMLHNNEQLDFWSPENPDASHPILHAEKHSHNQQTSTYCTRSSAFLRLRNLELKYSFRSLLKKKNFLMENIEVYANGQNLFTWSDLPDSFDPEDNKLEVYPISKRFNFGFRLTL